MKEEMKLMNQSIIINGVEHGAKLPEFKMDSDTYIVVTLHWASCLLYICFPFCIVRVVRVGVFYLIQLLEN